VLVGCRIQTPSGAAVLGAVQPEGEVVLGASPPARSLVGRNHRLPPRFRPTTAYQTGTLRPYRFKPTFSDE
jgi:hypothetical protein